MMQALANVPPAVWQTEHLDDLGAAVRDALDARDLSAATASQATWLILPSCRAIPSGPSNG